MGDSAGHLSDGRQPFNSLLAACALGLVRIFNNRQVQIE